MLHKCFVFAELYTFYSEYAVTRHFVHSVYAVYLFVTFSSLNLEDNDTIDFGVHEAELPP